MEQNKLVVQIYALQRDCAAKYLETQALRNKNTTLKTVITNMAHKNENL